VQTFDPECVGRHNAGAMPDSVDARILAKRLMDEWDFSPTRELKGGYCSVLFSDGCRVLKAPFQGEELTTGRIAAERMSGGAGPVVHRSDKDSGALLMDQIAPGEDLSRYGLSDREALPVFFDLAGQIRGLETEGLMPMSEFLDSNIPFISRLIQTSPEGVFLHGDLHHYNVLWGGGRWWAIDPKGLVGDPAFEAVAFLRNPFDRFDEVDDLPGFLSSRIQALASGLRVDASRVWAWSLADRICSDAADDHPWGRMRKALEALSPAFGGR
jgi:hypothetical protein